jgi:zinc/manganese transport system substrate-binding protein
MIMVLRKGSCLGTWLLVCSMSAWASADGLKVAVSFSILGDLVQQIGGDRVIVYTLVGPDSDAHVYTPTPADARRLSEADLVVVNGLGFEGWITRLATASGYAGPLLVASRGVQPLRTQGIDDPHAWQDVRNVMRYVENIAAELTAIDPDGAEAYRIRADDYRRELQSLHQELSDFVADLPAERRRVVTSHDAFGYFEAAYDLRFLPAQGSQPDAELSAREMAGLIRRIRVEGITALFIETMSNPRLLEAVARESGARIGGYLYSDALSAPDGPASTYLAMMRHNLRMFRAALQTDTSGGLPP